MLLKYYCTVLFSFRNIIISIYIIYLLYISFARSCCYVPNVNIYLLWSCTKLQQ